MLHKIIMIAAIDRNWAIGKNGGLIYNVPTDIQFFLQQTTGNIVVYGRKTLESFPGGKPLPNRTNIVLSNQRFSVDGCVTLHSVSDLAHILNALEDNRDVFICGGASVYEQFAEIADEAYITKIDAEDSDADAFFPNLDKREDWVKRATFVTQTDATSGLNLRFERYCRVS